MSHQVNPKQDVDGKMAGWVDNDWPTPISVSEPTFNFESTLALSIEREERYGHLDSGEVVGSHPLANQSF